MAPESIQQQQFSKQTDVYSFGITIWELLTGQDPYPDVDPVSTAVEVLVKGRRPKLADYMPKAIQKLMEACWQEDPEKRPKFQEIINILETFINEARKSHQNDDITLG